MCQAKKVPMNQPGNHLERKVQAGNVRFSDTLSAGEADWFRLEIAIDVIGSSIRISEQVYRRSSGGATPIGSSGQRPRFGMLRGRALIRGPRNSAVKRSDDQRSRRDPARSRDKFWKHKLVRLRVARPVVVSD
jgi:hypothetical protein